MESNIKHIIKNYQYFELDKAQKELISEWASNSDEFDALKHTFIATNAIGDREVNPTIKQRLDVRFADKYKNERLVWYNKLWLFLWPNDVRFYKRPLVQFAAICLIVVFTIPFFPNIEKQQLAMNESQENEVAEEKKKEEIKPQNIDVEINEEVEKVNSDKKDAFAKISKEDAIDMPKEIAEEQPGWQLNRVEDEKVAENELGAAGIANQRQEKSESLDDFEGTETRTQQDMSTKYFGADSDRLAEESLSSSTRSKDKSAKKQVEVEETLDLLTALY
jgi:hypothetical protein